MKAVDPSILKVPPQNLEAEQSVLGGILLENGALNPVLEIMAGSDFYSDAHRKIFGGILELSDRNQPVDLITLSNHLRDKKQLDAVGGVVYLSQLVDNVPSAANIGHYARIVKEKSVLRNLIGTATEILNRRKDRLILIAETLLEREVLDRQEFLKLFEDPALTPQASAD